MRGRWRSPLRGAEERHRSTKIGNWAFSVEIRTPRRTGFPVWPCTILLKCDGETQGRQCGLARESQGGACTLLRGRRAGPRELGLHRGAGLCLAGALCSPSRSHVKGHVVVILPEDSKMFYFEMGIIMGKKCFFVFLKGLIFSFLMILFF